MSVKPSMLKDDFTEKYYEEDNPHNKDLFPPDRAGSQNSPLLRPKKKHLLFP